MAEESLKLGVVVERRIVVDNPWIDHAWGIAGVLPDAPDLPPWTLLAKDERGERYYLGAADLVLYSVDTAHLRDNLATGQAWLWVSVRPTGIEPALELVGVTADPYEGEGMSETVGDILEKLPMPAGIAAAIIAFFETHHVERVFHKRAREAADPRKGRPRPAPGNAAASVPGPRDDPMKGSS